MATRRRAFPHRFVATVVLAAVLVTGCGANTASTPPSDPRSMPAGDPAQAATVARIAQAAMTKFHLRALITRVTADGKNVYTGALGESMSGVPATPDMHYRNGAFAFTYIGEIVAQMVDRKEVSLDDKLARWMPELPGADRVTIKNLLNMTAGYADYVYQPEMLNSLYLTPFRKWTSDDLIRIGVSAGLAFEPGTNFGYSHTDYVILGRVLEKITGKSMAELMQERIFDPMGLHNTGGNAGTPAIPEPVLHVYSSERRATLKIPASLPFLEDSTYWDPSWTTGDGTVQTTDVYDMTTSMEIVGSGKLVSPETYRAQVSKELVGFGKPDPTGRCSACQTLTDAQSYGLGVVLRGPWITQTKSFSGSGATSGYLPSQKLTVSVVSTYTAEAFDATGSNKDSSTAIFTEIATALAGKDAPPVS